MNSKAEFIGAADALIFHLQDGITELLDLNSHLKSFEAMRAKLFSDQAPALQFECRIQPAVVQSSRKAIELGGERIEVVENGDIIQPENAYYRISMRHPTLDDSRFADWTRSKGLTQDELGEILCHLVRTIEAWKYEAEKLKSTDTKTDTKKNIGNKIPPNDVNDVIRYVRSQRDEIAKQKRPHGSLRSLIAEYLSKDEASSEVQAMAKQLQPSRYGWMLDVGQAADK